MVIGEVQGALGHRVALELVAKLPKNRAAERQVAQVILERGEARDGLAVQAEGRDAIGDQLFRLRDDLEDRPTQRLKRAALGLLESPQLLVYGRGRHRRAV